MASPTIIYNKQTDAGNHVVTVTDVSGVHYLQVYMVDANGRTLYCDGQTFADGGRAIVHAEHIRTNEY